MFLIFLPLMPIVFLIWAGFAIRKRQRRVRILTTFAKACRDDGIDGPEKIAVAWIEANGGVFKGSRTHRKLEHSFRKILARI